MMDHQVDRKFGRASRFKDFRVKFRRSEITIRGYMPLLDRNRSVGVVSMKGPRELCGAVDLISKFRLQPYHEFFCKKAIPSSVSDTNYLKSVVGDREIRKGERLNPDHLSLTPHHVKKGGSQIHAFDLKVLWEAFEIRQAPSLCLFPGVERVGAAVAKYGYKGKRKHKSHKTKRKDNKRSKHHHHYHDKKDRIKK